MPRYRPIEPDDVAIGDLIRITSRHAVKALEVMITGRLVNIMGSYAHFDESVATPLYPTLGWEIGRVDLVLPDLPTTAGSVVLIGERAAVLRTDGWVWADGSASELGSYELETAEIVYAAR